MKQIKIISTLVLLALISACSKNNNVGKPILPVPSSGTNVYVAGFVNNGKNYVATLWKNGIAASLASATDYSEAYSVFVTNTDVYLAGYIVTGGVSHATLWKNGVANSLEATSSVANSVYVNGSDVYVCGSIDVSATPNKKVVIWKNGTIIYSTSSLTYAQATGISGSNSLIYTTGFEAFNLSNNGGSVYRPETWTTTSFTANSQLGDINADANSNSSLNGAFVDGSDCYAAGGFTNKATQYYEAAYWKNGTPTELTDGTRNAGANAIYVSGMDVYVVGNSRASATSPQTATLWKNGTPTALTDATVQNPDANSVFVSGKDVYVVGHILTAGGVENAEIWKNNVETQLSDGKTDASAFCVFVK